MIIPIIDILTGGHNTKLTQGVFYLCNEMQIPFLTLPQKWPNWVYAIRNVLKQIKNKFSDF